MAASVALLSHVSRCVLQGTYGAHRIVVTMERGEWRVRTAGSIVRRRPWIALAAVYALALQVLFSGLLIGQLGAASTASDGFSAICAAHSGSADADGTGQSQPGSRHGPICVFCTAAGSPAVLPHPTTVVAVSFAIGSSLQPPARDMIVAFASPTGHYQRGPPDGAAFAG
jgi:hypothetical protein